MMEIYKIKPQGYCKGVINALMTVEKAINNPSTKKPIYILGNIIHNKEVVWDLTHKGVITLENKNKTRLELLDEIHTGTVIFSAHGVSKNVYEKAKKKGLEIIDASCCDVISIHQTIEEKISKHYDVIYIGLKNHPESEGVLGISPLIHFVSTLDEIAQLTITNSRIYVTNQTTLSNHDIKELHQAILDKFPSAILENSICKATTLRQDAVLKQPKADLCIVVGDSLSSNTKKLFYVSKEIAKVNTILVENAQDLKKYDFTNIKTINITSGASTPNNIVENIIDYLNQIK